MNTGVPRPGDASALLRRYLDGESLALEELLLLADSQWHLDGKNDPRRIDALLREPPLSSGIAGATTLSGILLNIRKLIAAEGRWNAGDVEHYNTARERVAICFCADDTMLRERRMRAALSILLDGTQEDDLLRPTTILWSAEIALRLVAEHGRRELAGLARSMFHNLAMAAAEANATSDTLRFLSHFAELTLHQFPGAAVTDADWKIAISEILAAFKDCKPQGTLAVRVHRALQVSFTSSSEALAHRVSEAINALTTNHWDAVDSLGTLEQLFESILCAVRLRTAIGRPPHDAARDALCQLSFVVAKARSDNAHSLELVAKGELSMEALTRQVVENQQHPVDEASVKRHIDELLRPDATDRRGLALSGGGFRAACFHLGVLARLAERDELRRVDVISCVSGGAIAGAGYAVRLKALLASKRDLDITREDYLEVVEDLVTTLSQVMSSNLRMRALASPVAVLKLWLFPNFSLTDRISDLLDDGLFAPLMAGNHPRLRDMNAAQLSSLRGSSAKMTRPGRLRLLDMPGTGGARLGWPLAPWDLDAAPFGEDHNFDSGCDANRRRHAKLPEMVFNTTSVNTGAAFRFSGQAHGERPDPEAARISNRPRWTWMRYEDMNTQLLWRAHRMTLARVVGASASVPGILPPMRVRRLGQNAYITLADGGVFDNQGLDHLWESRCNRILLSDAAGQLQFQTHPDVSPLSLLRRTTDMLMERVREMGYKRLIEARAKGELKAFTHLHLTRELSQPLPHGAFRLDDFVQARLAVFRDARPTSFGVSPEVQALLARIRTDLDCFSDLEMYSLMLDGYRQTCSEEDPSATDIPAPAHNWSFQSVQPLIQSPPRGRYRALLNAAGQRILRLPRLVWELFIAGTSGKPLLRSAILAISALLLASIGWVAERVVPSLAEHAVVRYTALVLATSLVLTITSILLVPAGRLRHAAVKLSVGPLLAAAMVASWAVLWIADPLYRAIGRQPPKVEG